MHKLWLFAALLMISSCAQKRAVIKTVASSGNCNCTCEGTSCTCKCDYTCAAALPIAPTGLTAANQPNATTPTIKLDWKDNSTDETGFKIMRKASNGTDPFALVFTTSANITTYTNSGLTNYWQYDYEVIATSAAGDSAPSNTVIGTQALLATSPVIPPTTGSSIKDFGAKGDGVTDDKTSIQNAINSCAAAGTILFPAGTYKISGTLSVKANCNYSGQNSPILRGYTGTGTGGFTLMQTAGSNITITGITFDGGGINLPVEMQTGITISGNKFQNIVNTNGGFGPWQVAIYIPNTTLKSNIHHNTFYNILPGGSTTAVDQWMTGIRSWKLSEVVIADNTFDQVEEGIAISESADNTYTLPEYPDNKIQRNTFTHIRRMPIEIQAHKLRRMLIEDNRASQYLGTVYWNTFGISNAADGWDAIIRRNVFDTTGSPGVAGYCLEVGGGLNVLADNNQCRGTKQWKVGVMISYAPSAVISNNLLCGGFTESPTAYERPHVDTFVPPKPASFVNNSVPATCPAGKTK